MKLTPDQEKAANEIKKWISNKVPMLSLGGVAGSGKSFLLSHLKSFFPHQTSYAALTGKAARRLLDFGITATTLHSILYRQPELSGGGELVFNKINEPPCRYLVVDESSLISPKIFEDLQYWVRCGVKILAIGDFFQLPCILSDEDKRRGYSKDFSIFSLISGPKLTKVMRNTGDIITVASKIREDGILPTDNNPSYTYSRSSSLIADVVEEYVKDPYNTVVITWTNKVRMQINREVRKRLGHTNELPDKGEPIFICRNGNGVLNGEIKIVKNLFASKKVGELNTYRLMTEDGRYLLVNCDGADEFLDGKMPYIKNYKKYLQDIRKINEVVIPISPAYCSSTHKMQGSQAKKIILALYENELKSNIFSANTKLSDGSNVPFRNRFLYTAATRAEEKLTVIIGQ